MRAVLVLVHLFAITAMALPAPGSGLQRSAWSDPTVQDEFAAWEDRLRGWGLPVEEGGLEDVLWSVATGWQGVVDAVTRPFDPYYQHCGTWQSWRMFVAPHRNPEVLHVDIHEGGAWRPVYVENDPAYTWHGRQFDHDRMRAALFRYAWPSHRRYYGYLVDWIAKEAARDFPDARRVRVRYYKYRTRTPEEVRAGVAPTGHFEQRQVRRLAEYR